MLLLITTIFYSLGIASPSILHCANDGNQNAWIKLMNEKNYSAASDMYLNNAGLLSSGSFKTNKKEIIPALKKLGLKTGKIISYNEKYQTSKDNGGIMSLGILTTEKGSFGILTAWSKNENQLLKEFEYVRKLEPAAEAFSLLDAQRRMWESYSNGHNPRGLIENVYSPDAIYFNQGKVDKGVDEISIRYNYMQSEGWKIRLEKAGIISITSDEAIEIGRYYSSGEGQYLLIWQKDQHGDWKIGLDFNF